MVNDKLVVELKGRGLSNYQIGEIVGCSEATVRRALKRTDYQDHLIPEKMENFQFTIDHPLILRDEDVMVTADWHIPLMNVEIVNQMIERARKEEITNLIVGGDLFNFDALSAYDPKQEEAGLEREIESAKVVMHTLGETFNRIVFIWGNHDARLHRALGYKAQFSSAMRWLFGDLGADFNSKLHISNLDHMWVEFTEAPVDKRSWRICHPQSYSRIPLSTPRTLAAKYNSNVICAHAHHAAIGFASDGIKTCVEIGGLFNQHVTAYLQRSTTFPTWTPGYGWFKDGHFSLTTPSWSVT